MIMTRTDIGRHVILRWEIKILGTGVLLYMRDEGLKC